MPSRKVSARKSTLCLGPFASTVLSGVFVLAVSLRVECRSSCWGARVGTVSQVQKKGGWTRGEVRQSPERLQDQSTVMARGSKGHSQ